MAMGEFWVPSWAIWDSSEAILACWAAMAVDISKTVTFKKTRPGRRHYSVSATTQPHRHLNCTCSVPMVITTIDVITYNEPRHRPRSRALPHIPRGQHLALSEET